MGRVTLSRAVAALLRRQGLRVESGAATSHWTDHVGGGRRGATRSACSPTRPTAAPDLDWATTWQQAGQAVAKALGRPARRVAVGARGGRGAVACPAFWGDAVPRFVERVRDVDLALTSSGDDLTIVASRGLAGIDGCVSTAVGVALAGAGPAYASMGDLTFLHDANGLLVGPHEPTTRT